MIAPAHLTLNVINKAGCVDGSEVRRGRCLISGLSRAIPCWVIRQFIGFCTPSSTQFSPFALRICLLTCSSLIQSSRFLIIHTNLIFSNNIILYVPFWLSFSVVSFIFYRVITILNGPTLEFRNL